MNRKGQSFAGVAFIMTDDRVLCNTCYQNDETAVLEDSVPDNPLNYPIECEECECTLVHQHEIPDQDRIPDPR